MMKFWYSYSVLFFIELRDSVLAQRKSDSCNQTGSTFNLLVIGSSVKFNAMISFILELRTNLNCIRTINIAIV